MWYIPQCCSLTTYKNGCAYGRSFWFFAQDGYGVSHKWSWFRGYNNINLSQHGGLWQHPPPRSARMDLNKMLDPNQILLWHKRGPSNFSWWFWNLRQRCRKLFEFKWTGKNVLSIISPLVWIGLIDHPLAKPLILYRVFKLDMREKNILINHQKWTFKS